MATRWPRMCCLRAVRRWAPVASATPRPPVPPAEVGPDDLDADFPFRGRFAWEEIRAELPQAEELWLNTDRPLKGVSPYAMSKAGMGSMTRALAAEWGPHQVRVNALAPGFILTDLTNKLWSDPTMQAWNEANCPLGRLGQPEDMVGTALFLASPASAFMTGQILYVDGGVTAGTSWPIPL